MKDSEMVMRGMEIRYCRQNILHQTPDEFAITILRNASSEKLESYTHMHPINGSLIGQIELGAYKYDPDETLHNIADIIYEVVQKLAENRQ